MSVMPRLLPLSTTLLLSFLSHKSVEAANVRPLAVKVNIKQLTFSSKLLISLQDAKDHLRVTNTDQDSVIKDCIRSAVGLVEKYTNQTFLSATFCAYFDTLCSYEPIYIWRYPITEITSLKYLDSSGVETTFSSSNYSTDITDSPARILPTTSPTVQLNVLNPYRIYFTAGYSSVSEIDPELIGWVKIFTAFFYQTRQPEYTGLAVNEIAYNHQRALDKYRKDPIV